MTVELRVQEVLREVLADDTLEVGRATTAKDVAGWDSLAHINLLFALEGEFALQFPDEVWAGLRSVGDICDYLSAHGT